MGEPLEYYTWLATAVPPGDLARAAARRLVQRATGALRRPLPTDGELLDAFCAEDAADLALKMAAPRASPSWADASHREEVARAAARVPGAKARALAAANAAWAREFQVFGRRVAFGRGARGIDWRSDFLGGGGELGFDPKAPWAIARMDCAVALGLGVWLADDEADRSRFAREFVFRVKDFARSNPPVEGVNWLSAMEAALRAANLVNGFLMMRHRPELQDPEFARVLASLLAAHGRFVEARLERTGASPNNHYVADLVGLLHLGVAFGELPGAKAWRSLAIEELEREIRRQVLDDGFSFEGSTSYHRLATELFTLGLLAARAGGVDLGAAYRGRLQSMYRAVAAYLGPDGTAPQIGDNDSGRALPFAGRGPLEHGYLLPLGAALFGDPELKPAGAPPCDEALFLLGAEGIARYLALPENEIGARSSSLPRGGVYVLRSGEASCAVSCGPNGQGGVGGHGHNDKLAIEVRDGARLLVADPGTYCYTSNPALRNRFRSTAAHSTLQVDGAEQGRILEGRLFALPDDAKARAVAFESSPRRDRFVGEHRGFERLGPGLRHRREVVLDRAERAVLVIDRLPATHLEVVVRYQLPDEEARWRRMTVEERGRLAQLGVRVDDPILELGPAGDPRGALALPGDADVRLAPAWYSPGYGERRPSIAVEVRPLKGRPIELAVAILMNRRRTRGEP